MDLDAHLIDDSERFAALLATADAADPVGSCPAWTALDLANHLAEVQESWGTIVLERLQEPPTDTDASPPSSTMADAIAQFREQHARLRDALAGAEDDTPVWTWADVPGTVGWARRRMAHEALVHRLDAQHVASAAAEVDRSVDAALAADGIDELIGAYLVGVPDWSTFTADGRTVNVQVDGGPTWGLQLGRLSGTSPNTGHTYAGATALTAAMPVSAGPDPTAMVAGDAATLHAWLWGRGEGTGLRWAGDRSMRVSLRDFIAEATQ